MKEPQIRNLRRIGPGPEVPPNVAEMADVIRTALGRLLMQDYEALVYVDELERMAKEAERA